MKFKENGLTFVETLLAISIFSAMMAAVFTFISQGLTAQNMNLRQIIVQSNARYALKILSTELRGMQYSEQGAYPIEKAESDALTFYSDIDADGKVEKLRYFLENNELKRGLTKPSGSPPKYNPDSEKITTFVKFVRMEGQPIFKYYDGTYRGTEPPLPSPVNLGKIRLIQINLIIDINPHRSPPPFQIETAVVLRNLKDNL